MTTEKPYTKTNLIEALNKAAARKPAALIDQMATEGLITALVNLSMTHYGDEPEIAAPVLRAIEAVADLPLGSDRHASSALNLLCTVADQIPVYSAFEDQAAQTLGVLFNRYAAAQPQDSQQVIQRMTSWKFADRPGSSLSHAVQHLAQGKKPGLKAPA